MSNDWNKELVLESIEDFIEGHGYYPTSKEMDNDPMMPAHASAYLAMGMGYTKVKETYFPNVLTKSEHVRSWQCTPICIPEVIRLKKLRGGKIELECQTG